MKCFLICLSCAMTQKGMGFSAVFGFCNCTLCLHAFLCCTDWPPRGWQWEEGQQPQSLQLHHWPNLHRRLAVRRHMSSLPVRHFVSVSVRLCVCVFVRFSVRLGVCFFFVYWGMSVSGKVHLCVWEWGWKCVCVHGEVGVCACVRVYVCVCAWYLRSSV